LKNQEYLAKENINLSSLIAAYKNSSLSKEKIISAVSLFVYNFPSRNCNWSADECGDFFIFFFPRLNNIIEFFEFTNIPFEAYLVKTIKFQIKTFLRKRRLRSLELKVFKNKEFWNYSTPDDESDPLSCLETEETYLRTNITSSFIKKIFSPENLKHITKSKSVKKRILMFVLKHIKEVRETEIPFIADSLGCERDWFLKAFYTLTENIARKEGRKILCEERRNKYFCKLYLTHERYAFSKDEKMREKYKVSINTIKTRIIGISKTIDSIIVEPTHDDIAYIMGVPKGTVDSGLFYLKTHLENILPF
jgi:hypothetical protein